jgi:tetratricopeptide (TPR) repeat protein
VEVAIERALSDGGAVVMPSTTLTNIGTIGAIRDPCEARPLVCEAMNRGPSTALVGFLEPYASISPGQMVNGGLARVVCTLAALAVFSTPWPAVAQTAASDTEPPGSLPTPIEEQARALFESGEQHYVRGEYSAAAEDFREALRISRKPELLYDLAQAERLSGDCSGALEHYREFQATDLEGPTDLTKKIAEMERCVAQAATPIAPQPRDASVAPPKPRIASAPPSPASVGAYEKRNAASRDAERRSTLGVLGWASLGGAALSAAFGTVLALRANAAQNELEKLDRHGGQWGSRYESYEGALARDRNFALGMFIGSAVLAGSGAWLLLSPPSGSDGDGMAAHAIWDF